MVDDLPLPYPDDDVVLPSHQEAAYRSGDGRATALAHPIYDQEPGGADDGQKFRSYPLAVPAEADSRFGVLALHVHLRRGRCPVCDRPHFRFQAGLTGI